MITCSSFPVFFPSRSWSWGYDSRRPWVAEAVPPPTNDCDEAPAGATSTTSGSGVSSRTVHAVAFERHIGHMRYSVHVPESSDGFMTQPPELLLTDNETNFKRLYGNVENIPPGSVHKVRCVVLCCAVLWHVVAISSRV